ncbi:dihydropyrimidinase [Clostridium swellfunianum]|uniref:dihydropyrimidinase n=1 Tax=Clostridium swellfunianum TaxID=1367462 RepID=UPI00202FBA91|nr:dihydropyrimidinase [Clostridium swellfunianum]MCM0648208.1 dihydropyrimidinase [Clostridium swellfunianum]
MGVILQGGTVVTSEKTLKVDVLIEDGKIAEMGENIEIGKHRVIKAEGNFIFPGGIDPHTHFDLDVGSTVTADDFATGTKAALIGGTTTIIDFATQDKGKTLKEAVKVWHGKADNKSYCNYGFHMAITDWNKTTASEMEAMKEEGITSFKMYMAYKKTLQVDDGAIYEALERSKEVGALIGFHCENGDIIELLVNKAVREGQTAPKYHSLTRPVSLEKEAITRVLNIAEIAGAPVYVVHLSSKAGLEAIKEARLRGVKVYAETCPQYLLLNDKSYEGTEQDEFNGAKYVMSPPLRKEPDQEALWKGLAEGDIETTATDHCSFNYKGQKELGKNDFSKIPNGGPGVEHRMALLYTNGVAAEKISLNKFVEITSEKAARLFGMYPQKGTISLGSDADIVIWDPKYEGVISCEMQHQNVDYTPYEGFKQRGRVKHVFLNGELVVEDGKLVEDIPKGKYVYRKQMNN